MTVEIDSLKTVTKGATIIFFGMVLSKLFSYLYRIFISQVYGPENYGIFSLGIAIISILWVLSIFGLHRTVTRYVAYYNARKDEESVKGSVNTSLKIVILLSFIYSAVLFVFSDTIAISVYNEPSLSVILKILSLSIPAAAVLEIMNSVHVGFKRVKYQVYSENIFLNLGKLVLAGFFALVIFGLEGLAWSWVLATIAALTLSFTFLNKRVYKIFSDYKPKKMSRELIKYSYPIFLAGSLWMVVSWTDTLMLGYFKTALEVGIYNAALPTSQLLLIASTAFGFIFLPVITELYSKHKDKDLKSVYKRVSKWIFYVNFPILLLMVVFAGRILGMTFGPEFVEGYVSLSILSIGFFANSLSFTSERVLAAMGKTKFLFYNSLISVIFNFILNLILIPPYGIVGAAVATTSTLFLLSSLLTLESYSQLRFTHLSSIFYKSIVAGLVSAFLINFLVRSLFETFSFLIVVIFFLVFVVLYLGLLIKLGGFEKEDVEILSVIERRVGLKTNLIKRIMSKYVK